jgi:SAM-dependent methyltransferase
VAVTIVRCRICGLITADPLPVPQSVTAHYDVSPETYWTDDYFASEQAYMSTELAALARLRKGRDTGARPTALDVGAGLGKGMRALERAGFDTYGFEPSPAFRNRALELGASPERLALGAIEDAAYTDNSFDFVNLGAVVEHLVDPAAALEKAARWLRPGGFIFVEVPSSNYLMARLARLFYRVTGSDFVANISPMHPPYHLYEFTVRSFELHGARAGYRVQESTYHPCQSYMPRLVAPAFDRIMEATDTGMQLTLWLTK